VTRLAGLGRRYAVSIRAPRRSQWLRQRVASLGAIKSNPDRNTWANRTQLKAGPTWRGGYTGAAIAIFGTGRDASHLSSQHAVTAQQPHVECIAEVNYAAAWSPK